MAFETTTSTFGGNVVRRKSIVAWSYTKIKNFRACPSRHFHYDIAKTVRDEDDGKLKEGFEVHEALARRIEKAVPLPATLQDYEPIVQEFMRTPEGVTPHFLVEQKLAITEDYQPCTFFDKNTWFRAVADAVKITGPVALNWDWKTGKPKDDPLQILTAAAAIMIHYPQVQAVRNELIWLEHGLRTRVDLKRSQMPELWASILPEVRTYEEAVRQQAFPPKQNGLCRNYCRVSTCQFHPDTNR